MKRGTLPSILIVDDLFGRTIAGQRNEERANLCLQLGLQDHTGDHPASEPPPQIKRPLADAWFMRGQTPSKATVGSKVQNDASAVLRAASRGPLDELGRRPWSLILLDLQFVTGTVTEASNAILPGTPESEEPSEANETGSYFGLELLQLLTEELPDLPVVILSSIPRELASREYARHGAVGFLQRNSSLGREELSTIFQQHGLLPDETGAIVGTSMALLKSLRDARAAALAGGNIFITGESGTGKDLLAEYIHRHRPDSMRESFVTLNCAGLSAELYASELFGHVAGAFTDARSHRRGKIEEAGGGDLFMDEVGTMPLKVQAGLLRVLEDRRVSPIGSDETPRTIDVRFIFATNEDLDALCQDKLFREDLLFRMRESGEATIPPLRERMGDIKALVGKFLAEAEAQTVSAIPRDVSDSSYALIAGHEWPGNIRELRHVIRRAVRDFPTVEHLMPHHLKLAPQASSPPLGVEETAVRPDVNRLNRTKGKIESIDRLALPLLEAMSAAVGRTCEIDADGEPQRVRITAAMRLFTGIESLTTVQAADFIKRMANLLPILRERMESDPLLNKALEDALRLRASKKS